MPKAGVSYAETDELQLTHYKVKQHGRYIDSPLSVAGPVHMIFDENTRTAGKLVLEVMTWSAVMSDYQWSEDNEAEVANGTILRADRIEELAVLIGKDPVVLAEELARYNAACETGVDERLGHRGETLIPLSGPYYAVAIKPAIVCTGGGARRNIESEVLDWDGQPIPRLYEAGELGSMFSDLYQNGSYLTEAMISGRAAGANAVRLEDWDRQQQAAE